MVSSRTTANKHASAQQNEATKRQLTERVKIFTNHIYNKGFIPRIYELIHSIA